MTVEITETLEELDRFSPVPSLQKRIEFLKLLKCGNTLPVAAAKVGCHPRTARRWIQLYRDRGIASLLQYKPGRGRKSVVPDKVRKSLEYRIKYRGPAFTSYSEVQAWLKCYHNLTLSRTVVYCLVKERLNADAYIG